MQTQFIGGPLDGQFMDTEQKEIQVDDPATGQAVRYLRKTYVWPTKEGARREPFYLFASMDAAEAKVAISKWADGVVNADKAKPKFH